MTNTVKKQGECIDILKEYSGSNPYILKLKRDVVLYQRTSLLTDYAVEYIIKNKDMEPKPINKVVKIADWYGEKLQNDYEIEFKPEKIKIITFLGETSIAYHCYILYRQNMQPMDLFLPKKAILGNFLMDDYHNYQVDFNRYDRLSMSKDPNRKLKAHQKEGIQFLLSRKKCIIADDMGLGKLEPISSLIPTPGGFKKMGDIKKGDFVFDQHGKKSEVTAIFPHKDKEIYRVTFSDNTYVDCGLDHLWTVRDSNMRIRKKGWKVMSLKELIDSGLQYNDKNRKSKGLNPRNKWEIPVCDAVEYEYKEYFIHPYILGVCLGDGNLCNSGIHISIPDLEIETSERISSLLNEDYKITIDRSSSCPRHNIVKKEYSHINLYNKEIKQLCLNVKGEDKFIPEIYKLGSIEQRLDLLRGLMDSDGSIRNGNKIGYYTNSKQLADDVKELVCSLGGTARIHSYNRTKEGKNIEYHVLIQIKYNPFYLKRKAEKYQPTFKKYCTKYIVSAEYNRNEDAQCIAVNNNEHTYLTGKNYIVTHNTTQLAVASIEGNFDSIVIICPAAVKTNWKRELMWYIPERDITIIEGYLNKKKPELEKYLGYGEGKSGKSVAELQEEAKLRGKWSDNRYVIVNYDILDEFYEIPETRSRENIEKAYQNSPLLQFVANKKALLIVDESHRLSNTKAKQYKIIKDFIKRGDIDSVYLATGTPITNDPENYFNMLSLIGDSITDDWDYYMKRYCGARKIPYNDEEKEKRNRITNNFCIQKGKANWFALTDDEKKELNEIVEKNCRMKTILGDAANLDELKLRTSHLYLRRLKEDITDINVNKTVNELFYDFDMKQEMEYRKLWEDYENAQLELDPTKEINKELIEGGIYRRYCADEMVPNTIKLANKFIDKGEKVVIICCYDDEIYTLKDYFGEKCVMLNGKTLPKDRDKVVEDFYNVPEKMVFLANIKSAGVGINLVCSHVLIFNDFDYVPGNNRQAEDRVYRMGQTKDVDIYYQIFNNTQYERMWNTVLRKELVINQVIKKEGDK